MKARFTLLIPVSFLLAAPAEASTPTFATFDECNAFLANLFRGGHAMYCDWSGNGWVIVVDESYKKPKKPK